MLCHVKIYVKFLGQKVHLVHGFTYENYYSAKKYHSMLAFIMKLAWVNETKSFESVLQTRHLSLLIDILTFRAASVTNINPEKFDCGF